MLDIYIDADGCPVKDEVYRVAERYALKVFVVCNRPIHVPNHARIERIRVGGRPDEADDWIAERIQRDDVVITSDIPLAARCLERAARVVGPRGDSLTAATIGEALAMRELLRDLRDAGEVGGGPPPMAARDRSKFLSRLDEVVQALRRQAPR